MHTHTHTQALRYPQRAGVKQALLLSGTCFGFAFQISLFFTQPAGSQKRKGKREGKG